MARVRNAVARRRRKNRIFKNAKGFWGDRRNHIRLTKDAVMRAQSNSYSHRKKKKGDFRKLWITRIGIAAKINGMSYSKMMNGLQKAKCELNRKMLAELAVSDPASFAAVAKHAQSALA